MVLVSHIRLCLTKVTSVLTASLKSELLQFLSAWFLRQALAITQTGHEPRVLLPKSPESRLIWIVLTHMSTIYLLLVWCGSLRIQFYVQIVITDHLLTDFPET